MGALAALLSPCASHRFLSLGLVLESSPGHVVNLLDLANHCIALGT